MLTLHSQQGGRWTDSRHNNSTTDMKRKRLLKNIALWTVILLVALTIGGGGFMLRYSLTNTYHQGYSLETELDSMAARNPEIAPWLDSIRSDGSLRDTFITAHDGVRLHALYVNAPQPTSSTALLLHGYTDDATMMLNIGHAYNARLGFNIFLPDFRAHGLSEGGDIVGMGWADLPDLNEWLRVVRDVYSDSARVVVHGVSMGGAAAINIAGQEPKEHADMIRCYIDDCGYTSVWDEFASELDKQFGLPTFPLLHTASGLCKIIYGWSFGEAAPVESVKNCRKPLLIIHGDADTYVPTEMGLRIYDNATCEKEIWLTKGVEHAKSYRNDPEAYTRRIDEFTRKHM